MQKTNFFKTALYRVQCWQPHLTTFYGKRPGEFASLDHPDQIIDTWSLFLHPRLPHLSCCSRMPCILAFLPGYAAPGSSAQHDQGGAFPQPITPARCRALFRVMVSAVRIGEILGGEQIRRERERPSSARRHDITAMPCYDSDGRGSVLDPCEELRPSTLMQR